MIPRANFKIDVSLKYDIRHVLFNFTPLQKVGMNMRMQNNVLIKFELFMVSLLNMNFKIHVIVC